jgi:hypothetical protein
VIPLPIKAVAAVGAWASLVVYIVMMTGFFGDLADVSATATAAPALDDGLTNLAALAGTAVLGVIAGLAGVSIAKDGGKVTGRLGLVLTAGLGATSPITRMAGPVYLVAYLAVAVKGLTVWRDIGTDLTPEFVRTQVLAAIGLLGAMAAVSANR